MKNFAAHHENATARSLGLVRAVVFTLWIVVFFRSANGVIIPPSELFQTFGLGRLIPRPLLEWLLGPVGSAVFPWVFLPVLAAAALGLRPFRFWGLAALPLIFWLDFLGKGFSGFIYHAHAMILVAALVLACSPAADGFALRLGRSKPVPPRPPAAYGFPLLVMLAAGLMCYSFIAMHRFTIGGPAVFHGDALRSWLFVRSLEPGIYPNFSLGLIVANSALGLAIYKAGFLVSTIMEVLAPVCVVSRRFALVWLLFITVFHFLSLLTLGILFWENTILLWLLLAPVGAWCARRPPAPPTVEPGSAATPA